MLIKRLINDTLLLFLLAAAFFVHLFSLNEDWVERYYSMGIYPHISYVLRTLLGWIPFSIGDLIYFIVSGYLVWWLVVLIRRIRLHKADRQFWSYFIIRFLRTSLFIYLLFNVFWGLNYNRKGIAYQLQIERTTYGKGEVLQLTTLLHERLNATAKQFTLSQRAALQKNSTIRQLGIVSYHQTSKRLPYLIYKQPSIKPSLYTHVGHFFGFTGYYNPLSGEAQLKTTVPRFLQPFIINHEIAHQVGYAKENEANFVAFITGNHSSQIAVKYAAYFEAYLYAARDLRRSDSTIAKQLQLTLHPLVQRDLEELQEYLIKNENAIEPYISRFYDQFLKLNKQPKGTLSYNEVVALLIAYLKKYGATAI